MLGILIVDIKLNTLKSGPYTSIKSVCETCWELPELYFTIIYDLNNPGDVGKIRPYIAAPFCVVNVN